MRGGVTTMGCNNNYDSVWPNTAADYRLSEYRGPDREAGVF